VIVEVDAAADDALHTLDERRRRLDRRAHLVGAELGVALHAVPANRPETLDASRKLLPVGLKRLRRAAQHVREN
jgi:hypothetical protein